MSKPFKLSNRQRKELGERGSELQIAIPHPAHDVEPLEYARQSIDVLGRWIHDAEVIELTVQPMFGSVASSDVLPTCFGQILHEDEDGTGLLTYQVVAVVATICQTKKPRHRLRTQWAARWEPLP
jgi:hypothetical protein